MKAPAGLIAMFSLGLAVLVHDGRASACINGVEEERRYFAQFEPPARVAKADRMLDRGHHLAAAAEVLDVYPHLRAVDGRTAAPLVRRALRVLALAIVRASPKPSIGGWSRWANLEWAAATLAEVSEARGGEPAARADLAEALAALPRDRDRAEALETLEDLDRRDLMGSVNAYLALARLRMERGDDGGAHAAVRRCHAMSSARDRCALPPKPT